MKHRKGRPRLAYLTGEYPRTTDTFIQREVAALRGEGFEVETFAVRRPGSEHLVGPEQEAGQASTTYLLELARTPAVLVAHLSTLLRSPARYLRTLGLAWRTRRPGLIGSIYQLAYFVEAVLLADQLRRRRIDHLHNHFGDSSCTVAMLAGAAADRPYSFTLHGSAIFFDAHSWQLGVKLDRAAFTATISHFTRSQAGIFASPETMSRVHIIHCGVVPGLLDPVVHDGPGPNLVFVGRVVEQKGLGHLFEAMAALTPDLPDLRLTVVGDGPDRSGLERRARSMGLDGRVEFVGAKSQADVAALLARADVFVLPSYAEGVPVVVMEALGTGLPVVASLVGGMTELVDDGVSGFLVRPADPEQLADRIARLVKDPELRARFGAAGQARVASEFDSTVEARRLAALFCHVAELDGGGPARNLPPVRPEPIGSGDRQARLS